MHCGFCFGSTGLSASGRARVFSPVSCRCTHGSAVFIGHRVLEQDDGHPPARLTMRLSKTSTVCAEHHSFPIYICCGPGSFDGRCRERPRIHHRSRRLLGLMGGRRSAQRGARTRRMFVGTARIPNEPACVGCSAEQSTILQSKHCTWGYVQCGFCFVRQGLVSAGPCCFRQRMFTLC